MSTQNNPDSYPQEYIGAIREDYLALAAKVGKVIKDRAIEMMDIREGFTVLDAGCGSGEDLVSLANRVGAVGQVVGLDFDAGLLAEAQKAVGAANVSERVVLREGSLLQLPFADNHFDVVHTERVLMHIKEAETAVQELARVTKPGGKVVLVENDYGSFSVETPHMEIFRRYSTWAIEQALANGFAGRKLKSQMTKVGLKEIEIEIMPWDYTNYAVFAALTNDSKRVSNPAIALGVITQEEWEAYDQGLQKLDAEGAFFATCNLILTSGVKPA